jgi:methylthioribose-1-phosphate isomerase
LHWVSNNQSSRPLFLFTTRSFDADMFPLMRCAVGVLGTGEVNDGDEAKSHFLESLGGLADRLARTRPTAANLKWAVERQLAAVREEEGSSVADMVAAARRTAAEIANEDVEWCKSIGQHGLSIIRGLMMDKKPGDTFNILTHCNAGEVHRGLESCIPNVYACRSGVGYWWKQGHLVI